MNSAHLSDDLILRMLDDELNARERLECETHLAGCEVCRQAMASLKEFSQEVESVVYTTAVPSMAGMRSALEEAMQRETFTPSMLQAPGKVMQRFGWGMAIAATLALGILIAPKNETMRPIATGQTVSHVAPLEQTGSIEVDGETFTPVPFANADLPLSAPHIVQMQVPISSLADVGIFLEPVTNRMGAGLDSDRTVLADVLMGADGQPRGVHVLGVE